MSTLINSPFPVFTDTDGLPLEGGYIDIGVAGLNPLSNPLQVYWDQALTMPATNIRTTRGYPSRNGAAGYLYAPPGDFSILVRNKNGVVILSNLNIVDTLTVVQNDLLTKADLASPALTGVPTAPTAAVGTSTTQIATTEFVIQNLNFIAGKNKIINGNMAIDQRTVGAAKTYTDGAAIAYGVDRWAARTVGSNATGQQVAGVGSQYGYKITGAVNNIITRFTQYIESENAASLTNKNATLSIWIQSNAARIVTCRIYTADAVDNFAAVTQIGTETFSVTGTLTRFDLSVACGANAVNGIQIDFNTEDGLGALQWVQYENVQFEEGLVATAFDDRHYGIELALCQRYYEKSYNIGVVPGAIDANGSEFISAVDNSFLSCMWVNYKVLKRGTGGTRRVFNTNNGVNNQMSEYTVGPLTFTANRAVLIGYYSERGLTINGNAQLAAGRSYQFQWDADHEF